jgi:hypothetical protein
MRRWKQFQITLKTHVLKKQHWMFDDFIAELHMEIAV